MICNCGIDDDCDDGAPTNSDDHNNNTHDNSNNNDHSNDDKFDNNNDERSQYAWLVHARTCLPALSGALRLLGVLCEF